MMRNAGANEDQVDAAADDARWNAKERGETLRGALRVPTRPAKGVAGPVEALPAVPWADAPELGRIPRTTGEAFRDASYARGWEGPDEEVTQGELWGGFALAIAIGLGLFAALAQGLGVL